MSRSFIYSRVSVDCVLFSFDGEELKILLVEKDITNCQPGGNRMKLPGRLIFEDENLDEAAQNILSEFTGITDLYLNQFRAFGSPERTSNKEDMIWLENVVKFKVNRIVTVAYMSLIRISSKLKNLSTEYKAGWWAVKNIPTLAFDHNQIIEEALKEIQNSVKLDPSSLFELLPQKFTAQELRKLYEVIYRKKLDVRNFQKKINSMPYVLQTKEMQTNVAHRAARYYRFDRKVYNKLYGQN